MTRSVAERWRLLSGQDNWKNLLDPLDMDLRRYLIIYGQLAQATYDTFNYQKASKYAGDSHYSRKHLFSRVSLEKANPFKYIPTKFLYATSQIPVPEAFIVKSLSKHAWQKDSNWIGFVAVATDEGKAALGRRDIVITWRGTIESFELVNDFDFPLVPASPLFGEKACDAKVHRGWLSIYTSEDPNSRFTKISAREQVLLEVKRLMEEFKDEVISITTTGHSLGAALATLSAADIVINGFNKQIEKPDKQCPVTTFGFASPRVGDSKFKDLLDSMEDLRILRVRNQPDLITHYPLTRYSDVGEELLINTNESKYLKPIGNFIIWHALEVYLHGVAGTQGKDGGFDLIVKRDIGLLNKTLDILKDEYLVPVGWWCMKNKGMVQRKDGCWELKDHEKDADDEF
ncbi:hypothetical protein ACOSP7_002253 [Xanthoceras sorbifolium]|uniref:Phospholipase A1 n=1 Tax=Xanthoceras sorbifolium TaxID=99658 RepID=A0ABQ8GY50_9ROSI|nr:hypothetical protein JRO89_XSUnG0139600 [Xanthoceras sorbifolium]